MSQDGEPDRRILIYLICESIETVQYNKSGIRFWLCIKSKTMTGIGVAKRKNSF